DRLQLARFQKFLGNPDETGSWTIFTRFDAQIATSTLPNSMHKTLGGADNVRGYFDNTAAGAMDIDCTIELRTPLISNFIKGIQKSEDCLRDNLGYWFVVRLRVLSSLTVVLWPIEMVHRCAVVTWLAKVNTSACPVLVPA